MEHTLSVMSTRALTETEKKEVNQEIDRIITRHKNNRFEINRLVFESVTALTESSNYSEELASQGVMKRFWGGLTGKNRQLQNSISSSLARSQYASQQTLQKLAEQNLMSFELITAVNNKLNSSVVEIEQEINKIYGTLVTFFRKTKSDIIQLESRVERLERNVNLLNWQSSIEYQMWDGVEYTELSSIEKVVCLVRDFYDITNGKWNTSDLMLLKSAMSEIGLPPKELISYKSFIKEICSDNRVFCKLFGSESLPGIEQYPEYIALAAGIQKIKCLEDNESYVLENTVNILTKYGCTCDREEVKYELLSEYEKEQARVNIDATVNLYDFIMELLYNLEQIKEVGYVKTLSDKMKDAELLYGRYEIDKVYPMLQELADYGYTRAKYLLALIYETGHKEIAPDAKKFQELLDECIEAGDPVATVRRVMPLNLDADASKKDLVINCIDKLKEMANGGDSFAAEEYARCCINFSWLGIGENDYEEAVRMFEKAPHVLGIYGLSRRYQYGQGVEKDMEKACKLCLESGMIYRYPIALYRAGMWMEYGWLNDEKDLVLAFSTYKDAFDLGYGEAADTVGRCYRDGIGVEKDDDKAYEYYKKGADLGLASPIANVGWCYEMGRGVEQNYGEAIKYYKKSIELKHKGYPHWRLAELYLEGKGVSVNRDEAKRLLEQAIEYGEDRAKQTLQENFGS